MSAHYRVDVTIGPAPNGATWTWTVNRGDLPTVFPVLLDGMTFSWTTPDSPLWPTQPDPVTAQLGILAEDAADLDGIDRGVPILIRVWAGYVMAGQEFDSVTFAGRIGDVVGTPVEFTHPVTGDDVEGWQLAVTCVDYVADLGERSLAYRWGNAGSLGSVEAAPRGEITRQFTAAGITPPLWGHATATVGEFYPAFKDSGGVPVIDDNAMVKSANLLTSTVELLTQLHDGGVVTAGNQLDRTQYSRYAAEGWRRGIIAANLDDDGIIDPVTPYRIEWVSRRYGLQPGIGPAAPGEFGLVGAGVYGIVLTPPPTSVVIGGVTVPVGDGGVVLSADYLDYTAQWTRNKFDDPNVVTVLATVDPHPYPGTVRDWGSVSVSNQQPGEALVGAQVSPSRSLIWQEEAGFVAEMYLGDDTEPSTLWAASGFRWYASQDPAWPTGRALFPGAATWGGYSAPIVIKGVPASQRPNGRRWYVGVPKSVTWTFDRGEFYLDLDLFPRIPKPVDQAGLTLTWGEGAASFGAVKWSQLDQSDWLEYRLVRSTVYS